MLSQRLANIVFAVVVLATCVYFAIVAEGFKAAGLLASSGLPSKFFPQLMLGLTALCAVGVFVTYLFKGKASEDERKTVYDEPADARRGLLTLVAVVVGYFIWQTWGYVPMAVFTGAATLLAMGVRHPLVYIAVYLIYAAVYLVFTQLLGTQF
ncbi:MAG: tripartite tricarboxylate transporter TctB family protein [Granulosicoccus sp.]|nr:tripartite tricarboxylate transporter TctB family protein [Granulosicoccus sp.]